MLLAPIVVALLGIAGTITLQQRASDSRSADLELRRHAGTQFDPQIVETFLGLADELARGGLVLAA